MQHFSLGRKSSSFSVSKVVFETDRTVSFVKICIYRKHNMSICNKITNNIYNIYLIEESRLFSLVYYYTHLFKIGILQYFLNDYILYHSPILPVARLKSSSNTIVLAFITFVFLACTLEPRV